MITYNTEAIIVDFSGQLEMNTAEDRALFLVNAHRRRDLLYDVDEMSSLERGIRL